MKKVCVNFLLAIILTIGILTGCKKDKSTDGPTVTYKAPNIATNSTVVVVPTKLQNVADTNMYAGMAASYMEMANTFGSYAGYFTPPANATKTYTKSSSVTYTWTYGGINLKLVYSEDATEESWFLYISTSETNGYQLFIKGIQAKDEKSGSLYIYDYTTNSTEQIKYTWSIDTSNNVFATLLFDGVTDGSIYMTIQANSDNSGVFKYYLAQTATNQIMNVIWNTDGSGSYWVNYGGETYSGSWAANKK